MSRDPDEIREEIEAAREDLGETLEAIGDRVAPKHVAKRVKSDVDDKIDAIGDKVSPKRILARRTESIRSGLRNRGGSGMDTTDDPIESADANGQSSAGDSDVGRQAQNLRQRLRRASGTVTSASGAAVEQVRSAPRQARAKSESNPLVAGLVAFGGGLAVAALLPPSDRERQAASRVKDRIEPLKQQAVDAGRSVADELKPLAQSSIEQVKGRATEAAEEVKGQAQGTAEELKGQAKQATTSVKGQSKSAAQAVKGESKKAAGTVKSSAKQASRTVKSSAKSAVAKKAPTTAKRTPAAAKRTPAASTRTTSVKAPATAPAKRATTAKAPATARVR